LILHIILILIPNLPLISLDPGEYLQAIAGLLAGGLIFVTIQTKLIVREPRDGDLYWGKADTPRARRRQMKIQPLTDILFYIGVTFAGQAFQKVR
jgi:hypothetical protein